MQTTPRLALALSALGLLCAGWALLPAQQPVPDIKAQAVAGTVHMLEGRGGNIGVCAGPDGLLMIDDQDAGMAPKIQAALAALSKQPLRFVVNTHFHGDHTGANEVFGALAPIVAQANVRERMSKPPGDGRPASPAGALPVITFDESLRFHFNGEEIEVRHLGPAHTDGDSIVWFKQSNVVHLGDLFFNGRFPFIDIDRGGSVKGLVESVVALRKELPKDARLIPGHGALASMQDFESYEKMLVDAQALVAAALAAGKNGTAMKSEKLLSKYASWGWEFISQERFIDMLVREATAK